MIATDDILAQRLFEVIASLTPEEKAEFRDTLIAWANKERSKA